MQYTQRKLQRSVTETRRSRISRPRVSTRSFPAKRLAGTCPGWRAITFFIKGFGSEIDYRGRIVSAVEKPSFPVAVVMQRRPAQSRWADSVWEPHGVLADPGGAARLLREDGALAQWLHPGFKLLLHKDEAEGYYLNVSSQHP